MISAKKNFLIRVAIFATTLSFIGGVSPTSRPVDTMKWSDPVRGIRLGIESSRLFVSSGAAINVTVHVSNATSSDIVLTEDVYQPFSPVGVHAINSAKSKVPPTILAVHHAQTAACRDLTLKANQELQIKARINRLLDFSESGDYVVGFSVAVGLGSDGKPIYAESPKLEVLVVDTDEDLANRRLVDKHERE